MNECIFTGRLGETPELRATAGGISVCSFILAVDRPKNKDSDTSPDWLTIVAWRDLAEFVVRHLTKGRKILVICSAQTRTFEDKNKIKRKVVEFRAERIEFADANPALCRENPGDVPSYESPSNTESINDDDLPF